MEPATFPESTRYGAPARPVQAAAAVLRARARAGGVLVSPAPPVDLLAAVVVMDAWAALLGVDSLDAVKTHGVEARAVAAAALARAAGHPSGVCEVPPDEVAVAPDLLRLAEQHRSLARELCPDASGLVLMRAGSDLYAAGAGTRFAAFGALLQLLAEEEL